jgi:hypothetical protein
VEAIPRTNLNGAFVAGTGWKRTEDENKAMRMVLQERYLPDLGTSSDIRGTAIPDCAGG